MKLIPFRFWMALSLFPALSPFSQAANSPMAETLIENLTFMKSVYRAEYAPTAWKSRFADWSLEKEYQKAVAAATNNPTLTLKEAREILKNFVYSMKDYHVSISFESTEKATLPFLVKGAAGKLFLVDIDRNLLPESSFPFHVGDELVTFDHQTAAEAVAAVQAEIPGNVESTDRALAELNLTRRRGARGIAVPQGPVLLGFKPKGSDTVQNIQLIWNYSPEKIKDPGFASQLRSLLEAPETDALKAPLLHPVMSADVSTGESAYDIGARKSFIPALGTKILETEPGNPFYGYIYKAADRKLIGYIRISSYHLEDNVKAAAAFGKLIATFEAATDALVIDQVNNPGGSVSYLYSLASMLTAAPLATPKHEMALNQTDIGTALTALEQLNAVTDDESARKVLGETSDGYPVSYETVQFSINFLKFIISEWNAGRKLTRPFWIEGVDKINPNPIHYTKPILLLTNELDFSGGDFFPAIMQDNQRVTILGTRTAGAGGYVNEVIYPNDLGIARFRVTESIATRLSNNPIENLGVQPDIEYKLSEKDLTENYVDYVKAIQTAVTGLVK